MASAADARPPAIRVRQSGKTSWVIYVPAWIVAAGILPAVEPGLPARRKRRDNNPHARMDGSESGRQDAGPLRQAGCLPLRGGSWRAATVLQPRIGTTNRKRRQAGRTPNASRVSGTWKRRGSVWSAWSFLPLFGSGSWVAPTSNNRTRIGTMNPEGSAAFMPLRRRLVCG